MTLALSLAMAQRNWQVALAHLSISEVPEVGEERRGQKGASSPRLMAVPCTAVRSPAGWVVL